MDTYGDMVTLLLCFFVLLYSMSTISEENWKALVMSFNPDAAESIKETSGNEGPSADPDPNDPNDAGLGVGLTQEKIGNDMEQLYEALLEYVSREGLENNISVTKGDGKVFVTFKDVVFFNGDDATLREEGKPILEEVASMLSGVSESIDEIVIKGHTAQSRMDRPNDIDVDRNLSAQRAANALAYIQKHCTVDPARMISEGYGQWRPIASNDTAEGKAQNRRVEMVVSGRDLEAELAGNTESYYTSD